MSVWTKRAADSIVGIVAGAADQMVTNLDGMRAADLLAKSPPEVLSQSQRVANYVNFGAPAVAVGLSLGGVVKGDWETRLLVAAFQMASRRATQMIANVAQKKPAGRYWPAAPQLLKPDEENIGIT